MNPFGGFYRVKCVDNQTNEAIPGKIRNPCELGAIVTTCLALSACGGSSIDSSSGTGNLSLSITDAPIHAAQTVTVNFVGAVVKPEEGPALEFHFCKDPDSTNPDVDPPIGRLPSVQSKSLTWPTAV